MESRANRDWTGPMFALGLNKVTLQLQLKPNQINRSSLKAHKKGLDLQQRPTWVISSHLKCFVFILFFVCFFGTSDGRLSLREGENNTFLIIKKGSKLQGCGKSTQIITVLSPHDLRRKAKRHKS